MKQIEPLQLVKNAMKAALTAKKLHYVRDTLYLGLEAITKLSQTSLNTMTLAHARVAASKDKQLGPVIKTLLDKHSKEKQLQPNDYIFQSQKGGKPISRTTSWRISNTFLHRGFKALRGLAAAYLSPKKSEPKAEPQIEEVDEATLQRQNWEKELRQRLRLTRQAVPDEEALDQLYDQYLESLYDS